MLPNKSSGDYSTSGLQACVPVGMPGFEYDCIAACIDWRGQRSRQSCDFGAHSAHFPATATGQTMNQKPQLSFWQIWNMCFGFLGIQFGFALQNANVSRIFQTLGASMDDIPMLWIAAPLTGLIVQPIVGYLSDRTWTGLGRRRPYFLVGAVLATLALFAMPNSPTLWIAAGLLWVLDASINISMEPFRAFVGDQMPVRQRASG